MPLLPVSRKRQAIKKIGWHSQDTAENVLYRMPDSQGKQDGREGNGILEAHAETSAGKTRLRYRRRGVGRDDGGMTSSIAKREQPSVNLFQIPAHPVRARRNVNRGKVGTDFLDKLIMDHVEGKNVVVEVSMAKFWTTDMAFKVADRCLQLYGGYGYCDEYPISRYWRDIRVTRIFAGTNEIMKMIAARFMGL